LDIDLNKISKVDEFRCAIEVSLGLDETRNHVKRNDERDATGFNAGLKFTAKVAECMYSVINMILIYDSRLVDPDCGKKRDEMNGGFI